MATIEHKGIFDTSDVVVYTYGTGSVYGYRLLKLVYVDIIGEYRWICESIKIVDNEVVKIANGALDILSEADLKDAYPLKWTKDPKYKKGDILLGKDNMVFVYFTDSHVERLTPRKDMPNLGVNDRQGYSSLNDYETNFGPLTKAKPSHPYESSF